MYSPLDQILTDEDFPKLNDLLMKISELIDLQLIANTKGSIIFTEYLICIYFHIYFIMCCFMLPDVINIKNK